MATDIQYGGERRIFVASVTTPADDGDYAALENDTSFTLTMTRDETKHSVKGAANKISATHQKDYALKIDGELVLADPAYADIVAAFTAGTPIRLQGRAQYGAVGSKTQKVSWEGAWNVISLEESAPMNGVVTVTGSMSPADVITTTEGGRVLTGA